MSERQIIVVDSADKLSVRAAEEIVHVSGEAICTHGEFNLCLAGGSTPARAYGLLATRFQLSVDWKEVQFYFGDERCVAPDDPASNYAMAMRTILGQLNLKDSQVHRIRGEASPEDAAREYEAELRRNFNLGPGEFPRFDLMLLGLGTNCHILSLFPGVAALRERHRIALAVEVEDPHPHRVTLTAPVANRSARVMFVVSGADKAHAVKRVLEEEDDPERVPAHLIAPDDGVVTFLLDEAAASQLSHR